MSARYDDIDEDFDGEDNSPAGLRKALKKAQDAAKKAQEELAAEKAARELAEKSVKKSTLTEILTTKGVKPGLARWLEKDDVEATPEAVDAWLKENGEFFNVKAAPAKADAEGEEQEEEQEQEAGPEDEIPEDMATALTASQRLDQSGVSPSDLGTMQRLASLKADPRKVSYDDLVKQLADMGAPLV